MLKMILADDEPIITKGIRMLVDWEQMGIQIVEAYADGQKALHGILQHRPDIAILDIAMPGKTGIDILKELRAADSGTKVLFLSGFQDFEYARAAIQYGAVDYLLKPVKRESLIEAIGKCIPFADTEQADAEPSAQRTDRGGLPPETYPRLVEEENTTYYLAQTVLTGLAEKTELEQQLIRFSVASRIEEWLTNTEYGITFQKHDKPFIVLKGLCEERALGCLEELRRAIRESHGCEAGFVLSAKIEETRQIAAHMPLCLDMAKYFYFQQYLPGRILQCEKPAFDAVYTEEQLRQLRDEIISRIFSKDKPRLESAISEYLRAACILSEGRSDTAAYYLLSCIRAVEERLEALDVSLGPSVIASTMDRLREAPDYGQAGTVFAEALQGCCDGLAEALQTSEKKDIIKAKSYIAEHYAENITLETLARHIHMNSFYFSTFFKRQTGENFKDYTNKIRMRHAMDLLLLTNKRNYEIAEEVGFKDYRYFTELFSRYHGKTPTAFRKEQKKNVGDDSRYTTATNDE